MVLKARVGKEIARAVKTPKDQRIHRDFDLPHRVHVGQERAQGRWRAGTYQLDGRPTLSKKGSGIIDRKIKKSFYFSADLTKAKL
ncbi:MAG: hypothetical protein ACREBS_02070 [Nitrososphaerales archaeon]